MVVQEPAAAACRVLAQGDNVAVFDPMVFDPVVVSLADFSTPALSEGTRSNGQAN
jgi:hypothetical protein